MSISISHAQQDAGFSTTNENPVHTTIPADEESLATDEPNTLEHELQFLHSGSIPDAPTVNEDTSSSDDDSLTDALSEGLKSIFSEEEANQAEKTHSSSTEDQNTPSGNYTGYALLQGLNKITARTSSLEMALNTPVVFGTLEITVHKCWKSAPEEMQENKALIEIWEQKPGEDKTRIFNGWMFSSTPSISALENPVYDVTVIECIDKTPAKTDAKKAQESDSKEVSLTEKSPS